MIPLKDVQHWLCPIKYDPGIIFFNIFQDWPMVDVDYSYPLQWDLGVLSDVSLVGLVKLVIHIKGPSLS